MIPVDFVGGRFDGECRAMQEPLESTYVIAYPSPDIDWSAPLDENPEDHLKLSLEVYTLRAFKTGSYKELRWRYVL